MKDYDETKIDKEAKATLLNDNSPSINKGGDSIIDPKKKKKKKKSDDEDSEVGTITLSNEDLNNDEGLSEEPFEDFNKSLKPVQFPEKEKSEIDYNLPPSEFKRIYEEKEDNEFNAYSDNRIRELDNIHYGEGVEDYRDYIDNPIKGSNLDYNRALNQSNSEQFGNALGRFVTNFIPEVIQQGANAIEGVGHILGLKDTYGNPVSEAMQELKDWGNSTFDIYLENPDKSADFGDFAWWADRSSSLATSVTAFLALGYATGNVAAFSRLTNLVGKAGSRGAEIANVLKGTIGKGSKLDDAAELATMGKNGFNIVGGADVLANAALLTTAESIGVGTEVYHKVFDEKLQEGIINGLSEEEATQYAREAAIKAGDRAFNFNQSNILLNLTSVAPFLKRIPGASKGFIKPRTLGRGALKIGGESLQESMEESVNLLAEAYATDEEFTFSKAFDALNTREGLEAAFLGAIGGFAQTGLTLSGQYIGTKVNKETGKRESDYTRHKREFAAQEDLRAKFKTLTTAEKQNVLDLFLNVKEQTELHNKIQELDKAENFTESDKLREKLFTNQAYQAFNNGLGQSFKDSLENLKKIITEGNEELGYTEENKAENLEIVNQKIKDLKELEFIYNRTADIYDGKRAYNYASEAYYFEDLSRKNEVAIDKAIEATESIFKNSTGVNSGLKIDKETGDVSLEIGEDIAERKADLEKEISVIDKEILDTKKALSKEQDFISSTDNSEGKYTNQLKVAEASIEHHANKLKNLEEQAESKNKELANIENSISDAQYQADSLTEALQVSPSYQEIQHRLSEREVMTKAIAKAKENYDKITSYKGQKEAKDRYRKSKKALDALLAKRKIKDNEAKKKDKKDDDDDAKKGGNPDGAKSDLKDPKIILGVLKPVINKFDNSPFDTFAERANALMEEVNFLRKEFDSNPDKISEYMESQKGTMIEAVWSSDIPLFTALVENSEKFDPYDVIHTSNEAVALSNIGKYNLKLEHVNDYLKSTNNELINNFFKVLNVENTNIQSDYVLGLIKLHFSENADAREAQLLLDYYNVLKETKIPTVVAVLNQNNGFQMEVADFLDKSVSVQIANDLDSTFNLEGIDGGDVNKTEAFIEKLSSADKKEVDSFDKLLKSLLKKHGLDYNKDSFAKIVKALNEELGESITQKLFYKLQGFVSYKTGKRLNWNYSTYVKSKEEIEEEKRRRNKLNKSSRIEDFPTPTIEEIDENNRENVRVSMILEGVNLDEVTFESEETDSEGRKVVYTSAKSYSISNKIAYKAIGSRRIYRGGTLVDKDSEDVINTNVDNRLLKRNGVKVGDVITFEVIKDFEDNFGTKFTLVEENGNVFVDIKEVNQPVRRESAIDHLPIAVKVNGAVLKDAYVHLPSFINSENMVDIAYEASADQQRLELIALRKAIIDGNNVIAKVDFVTEGHLLRTKEPELTSVNLKNAEVGIGYEGSVRVTPKVAKEGLSEDYNILNGIPYALIPSGDSFIPAPLYSNVINKNQANALVNLVRLKLTKDYTSEDNDNIDFLKHYGFDITKNTQSDYLGFRNLLHNYIEMKTFKDDFDIKVAMQDYNHPVYFMKKTDSGFVFKIGYNKVAYSEIEFKQGVKPDSKKLEEFLKTFEYILLQSNINFNLNNLDKGAYPILTDFVDGEFQSKNYKSYKDFIKENSKTKFKSLTIDGEEVYTVQKSVTFELDTPLVIDENLNDSQEDDGVDFGTFLDSDFNLEETHKLVDSYEMSDSEKDRLLKDAELAELFINTEVPYQISGIPITYQERFVNSLISIVTDKISISEFLGTKKSKKPIKEKDIKKEFIKRINMYKEHIPSNLEKYKNILKFLESGGDIKKANSAFKNSSLYSELLYKADKIDFIKDKIARLPYEEEIATKALENVDRLMNFATYKLQSYTLINASIDSTISGEDNEDGKNIRTDYDSEYYFSLNGKDQLTANVKNILIGINNAKFYGHDDNGKPIIKNQKFFGLDVMMPFDQLYDEVVGILAIASNNYNNKIGSDNLFNDFIEQLSMHIENKPYLSNLIDKLKNLSEENKNAFTTNMSKSTVNHITTYMSESPGQSLGDLKAPDRIHLTSKATNSNENSLLVIQEWEDNFYSSELIINPGEEDVRLNQEKVDAFFKKADAIVSTVVKYKKDKFRELKAEILADGLMLNNARIDQARAEASKPDDEIILTLQELFSDIGFNFSENFIKHFFNGSYQSKGQVVTIRNFTENAGFIGAIKSLILDDKGQVQGFNKLSNPIFNDGYLKDFAKYVSRYESQVYAASYTNGEGKNIYGYALNKFISDRVQDLKSNPKLLKDLSEDVFSGDSLLLKSLLNEDGTIKENKVFDYFTYDSNVTTKYGFKAKKLNKLSSAGYEQVALNIFFNRGNTPNDNLHTFTSNGVRKSVTFRNGFLFAPTFSDSKTAMGLKSSIYNVDVDEDGNLDIDSPIVDVVIDEVVMPEYNRIRAAQNREEPSNIKDYDDGSKFFFFIPELNYAENYALFETVDGKIPRTVDNQISYRHLKDIETDAEAKNAMRRIVFQHLENLKNRKLEIWNDFSIVKNDKMRFLDDAFRKVYDDNASRLAYEYTINYLISNANYFKLFAGDPAKYFKGDNFDKIHNIDENVSEAQYDEAVKNRIIKSINSSFDNIGKRLASQIAPGTDILAEPNEKVTWAVISDTDAKGLGTVLGANTSLNMTYYTELLGKETAKRFSQMNGGDGGGYSLFKEWADIEFKRGNITKTQRNRLVELEKQRGLKQKDLDFINKTLSKNLVNPYKPVYFNNFKDGKDFRSFYVKQSSIPLISQLTEGLEIDNLRKAMVRDDVRNVVFESAVKVGRPAKSFNIFDKDGKIKDNISFKKEGDNPLNEYADFVIVSPRKGHKIQLDNPITKNNVESYEQEKKVTDGTQQRKLIFSDLLNVKTFNFNGRSGVSGSELRTEMQRYYSEIFKNRADKLAEELEYDKEAGTINLFKLQKRLKEEFRERGYPLSDLAYLGIVPNNKGGYDFKMPLWSSPLASKIESLLASIVDNNIRRLKSQGHSFVLGSSVGMKPEILTGEDANDVINNTNIVLDKEWASRGDGILRGQGFNEETGEVTPAEIMIASKFRDRDGNLIHAKDLMKDGFIDQDKISPELLEMFGYRIPTQGLNSMSYMKVVGFLPEQYSEMILAPSEFTTQMGSDFDIDKLYVNFYNYYLDLDNKLVKQPSAYINKEGEFETDLSDLDSSLKEQQLFNSILDIKLAILSNPDKTVQKKILSPLDDNVFLKYADEIETLYEDSNEFFSPISQEHFKNKYLNGTTGAEAIGVFANASTLHAILQNEDVNKHFIQKSEVIDGRLMYVDEPLFLKLGIYGDNKWRIANALSDPSIGQSNLSKADVFNNLVSIAVDNENEQALGRLNFNSETYNFIVGATMTGFAPDLVTYFVNQPIIRDYVNLGVKVSDSSVPYNNYQRFEDLYNKYGGLLEEVKDGNRTIYKFKDIDYAELNKLDQNPDNYDARDLRYNIIDRNNPEHKTDKENFYNVQQTLILHKYIQMQNAFKRISSLQDTVNIDGSNGLGGSLMYMQDKEAQFYNLPNLGIANSWDLVQKNEMIPIDDVEANEAIIKKGYTLVDVVGSDNLYALPTTIAGSIFTHALVRGNDMYNSNKTLFPYRNRMLQELTDIAFRNLAKNNEVYNLQSEVDLRRRAVNLVKHFLYTNLYSNIFEGSISSERQRLLVDTNERPSFITILRKIKAENIDKFSQNPLLTRLSFESGSESTTATLEFNATDETTSMLFIADAIRALLEDGSEWYNKNGIIYTGRNIALDLIRHQYLKGGIQFRKQFIKYIPFEFFDSIGIADKIRNSEFDTPNTDTYNTTIRRFTNQFLQHFPNYIDNRVDGTNLDIDSGLLYDSVETGTSFGDDIVRATISGENVVLRLIGQEDGDYVYKIVNTAGKVEKGDYEFDSSVDFVTSSIPENDKLYKIERARVRLNENRLKDILKSQVYYRFKSNEASSWVHKGISRDEYNKILQAYKDSNEEHLIEMISEKDEFGNVKIHSFALFKGLIKIKQDNVEILADVQEGLDYEFEINEENKTVQGSTKPTLPKSNIQKFKETLNIIDYDSQTSMANIIKALKDNNKDVVTNYLYDLILDSLPRLFELNPNLKLNIVDGNISEVVHSINGNVQSIILNANLIDTLVLDFDKSNKKNIHKVAIEEFLHSITKSSINANSETYAELDQIRLDYLNDLKENQPEYYKDYQAFITAVENRKAIQNILSTSNDTVFNIKKQLERFANYRHTESYKRIEEFINKAEANGEKFVDVDELKSNSIKELSFNESISFNEAYKAYYPFINADEFIAALFYNKDFQAKLNKIESKNKLTLLERLINLVIKALQDITNIFNRDGVTENWNNLFGVTVNKNSVLEEAVAKSIVLVKNFNKNKLTLAERKHISEEVKKTKMTSKDVNKVFNLRVGNDFQYIENAAEVSDIIRRTFDNVNVKTYKKNYVIVEEKDGEKVDLKSVNFSPSINKGEISQKENTSIVKSYKGNITPDSNTVFVFGSNPLGINGNPKKGTGGAALFAHQQFDVKQGEKMDNKLSKSGKAFGLTTVTGPGKRRSMTPQQIIEGIEKLYEVANQNPNKEFKVAYRNTTEKSLNGYTGLEMIDMFKKAGNIPSNIYFSEEWINTGLFNVGQQSLNFNNEFDFNLEELNEDELNQIRRDKLMDLRQARIKKLKTMINTAKANDEIPRFRFLSSILENLASSEVTKEIGRIKGLVDLLDIAKRDLEEIDSILNNPTSSFSEVNYSQRVLNNWNNVFQNYFTKSDQENADLLIVEFTPIVNKAESLTKTMIEKVRRTYEEAIYNETGEEIDLIEYFKTFNDVTIYNKEFADISRVDNRLLEFIHIQAANAFNDTKRESFDELQIIDSKISKALPHLRKYANKENGIFNILFQRYDDDSLTGGIVTPFSKSFIDEKKKKFETLYVSDVDERHENSKKVNKWLKDKTIYFNPLVLYLEDADPKAKEEHIKELKNILGETLYEYFKAEQDAKISSYELDKQNKLEYLLTLHDKKNLEELKEVPEAYNEYKIWLGENSPYIHYNQVMEGSYKDVILINDKGEEYTNRVYNNGYRYLINVPKNSSSYDSNFNKILNDAPVFEFYKAYTDTLEKLSKYLPDSSQQAIRFGGLPEISKTFLETVTHDGFANIYDNLNTNFMESIRTGDLSQVDYSDIDRTTGQESKEIQFNLFRNNHKEFEQFYTERKIKYEMENNGLAPTSKFKEQVEKEFNNMVAKRKSKDLGKIMKAFTGLALTYKHKSRIQDTVTAAEVFINSLEEPKRNADNKYVFNKFKALQTKPSAVAYGNLKEMYSHYVNNFFDSPYKLQGVSKIKVLTRKEESMKKTYIELLSNIDVQLTNLDYKLEKGLYTKAEYNLRKAYFEKQIKDVEQNIEEIGGNLTYSKIGDGFLKLFQLKGLGWNIMAGLGNLGFGVVGNLVEAADGRVISKKEMLDAMAITLNSIGRNLSFNKWDGKNGVALKIRNLMDRNDVLKEASHELYSNSVKGEFAKKLRFLSPYNMQKRTEYMNQAPIMIALYKKTKFTYNGEEYSLWDAYKDDGQWDSSKFGEESNPEIQKIINKANNKITQYIKRVHGNYDPSSPMKIKQGIGGRAVMQFKTWFVESWKQRWESTKYDSILEIDVKGRYRSIPDYVNSKDNLGNKIGYIGMLLDVFKGTALSFIGKQGDFEKDGVSDVDAANMRKIATEISMYLKLLGVYVALSMAFRGDDDEDEQHSLNLTLNMINRVSSEMEIYINPLELIKMAKNPAPAMGIVEDIYDIAVAVGKFTIGDDEISSGVYHGESRFYRSIKAFIPGVSQFHSTANAAVQEYDKGLLYNLLFKKE